MSLLTKKERESVALLEFCDPNVFIDEYQNSLIGTRSGYQRVTIGEMLNAFSASEELMKQYPIDEKVVKSILRSLLFDGNELWKAPELALVVDGESDEAKLYGVAGRHRGTAIRNMLELSFGLDVPADKDTSEDRKSREAAYQTALNTVEVLVRLDTLPSKNVLLERIYHDNQSRKMTVEEKTHIEVQAVYGLKPDGVDGGAITNILLSDVPVSKKRNIVAMYFTRYANKNNGKKGTVKLAPGVITSAAQALSKLIVDNENVAQHGSTFKTVFEQYLTSLQTHTTERIGVSEDDPFYANIARNKTIYINGALDELKEVVESGTFLKVVKTPRAKKEVMVTPAEGEVVPF